MVGWSWFNCKRSNSIKQKIRFAFSGSQAVVFQFHRLRIVHFQFPPSNVEPIDHSCQGAAKAPHNSAIEMSRRPFALNIIPNVYVCGKVENPL